MGGCVLSHARAALPNCPDAAPPRTFDFPLDFHLTEQASAGLEHVHRDLGGSLARGAHNHLSLRTVLIDRFDTVRLSGLVPAALGAPLARAAGRGAPFAEPQVGGRGAASASASASGEEAQDVRYLDDPSPATDIYALGEAPPRFPPNPPSLGAGGPPGLEPAPRIRSDLLNCEQILLEMISMQRASEWGESQGDLEALLERAARPQEEGGLGKKHFVMHAALMLRPTPSARIDSSMACFRSSLPSQPENRSNRQSDQPLAWGQGFHDLQLHAGTSLPGFGRILRSSTPATPPLPSLPLATHPAR
jgi:hypothetical protein